MPFAGSMMAWVGASVVAAVEGLAVSPQAMLTRDAWLALSEIEEVETKREGPKGPGGDETSATPPPPPPPPQEEEEEEEEEQQQQEEQEESRAAALSRRLKLTKLRRAQDAMLPDRLSPLG